MSLVLAPKGVHVWGKPAAPAAEVFVERARSPSYWAGSSTARFYRLADAIRGRRPAESPYAHTRPSTRVMILPSYAGASVGPQGSAVADEKGVSEPPAPQSYNSDSLDRHARQARQSRQARSDPYASTRPASTASAKEMLAANAGDSAAAGPSAQPTETAAAGPTPLEEIIGTANALADAVADVDLKDALDEVKQAALGLRTIQAKRPLSEDEKGQWADLDAALQRIAENAASTADPTAPTKRVRAGDIVKPADLAGLATAADVSAIPAAVQGVVTRAAAAKTSSSTMRLPIDAAERSQFNQAWAKFVAEQVGFTNPNKDRNNPRYRDNFELATALKRGAKTILATKASRNDLLTALKGVTSEAQRAAVAHELKWKLL